MRFDSLGKVLGSAALLLGMAFGSMSAHSALVITEVVEGTSGNYKYVEILNTSGASVNLTSPQIAIRMFANGAAAPGSTINLTGAIAAGGTYIIANNQANLDTVYGAGVVTASQNSTNVTHNGNDTIQLYDVTNTTVLDAFAGDWIGTPNNTTLSAADGAYFRVPAVYPNNGNWGGPNNVPIADAATSPSGFWIRRLITATNGNAATVTTPFTLGADEVPVELSSFDAE